MATLYPDYLPDNCPNSEIKFRQAFSAVSDITILHSVCWQSKRNKKQGDGEADFIVLVPKQAIIVIEVKGGDIEIKNGSWFSIDSSGRKHRIKDPFAQAKDSKYALINYLKIKDKELSKIPIVHAVSFPSISFKKSISMNAPKEIIIDRNDLKEPAIALERILTHWGVTKNVSEEYFPKVCALLAPTRNIKKFFSEHLEDIDNAIIELTQEQMKVLESLKRANQAIVYGSAGTGKTVLAMEKAKQLSEQGLSVLLICYNKLLQEKIKEAMSDINVRIETFHSLTLKEAQRAAFEIPISITSAWYENEAPDVLSKAALENKTSYEAVIIDEAQDFSNEWISSMRKLLVDSGVFYLFADSHQDLYGRQWKEPTGVSPYELYQNCRNTTQIARKVSNIFEENIEAKVSGPEPRFVQSTSMNQSIDIVTQIVLELLSEQVLPTDISILSNSGSFIEQIRRNSVGEHVYTSYGKCGIHVESIRKFKGLENKVVIVVLLDNESDNTVIAQGYVALSRARTVLYLVSSEKVKCKLNW